MGVLSQFKCVPCRGDTPPLTASEIDVLAAEVPDWKLVQVDGEDRLTRTFSFSNFQKALNFTLLVGKAAEAEDHHPAILTEYGKVTVTWWTHKIHGLHRNDFIMAAKTDEIYKSKSEK